MYYIGIDLGGMSAKAGIIDASGKLLAKKSIKTNVAGGVDAIISDMADLAKSLMQETKLSFQELAGIGIGIPGTVDSTTGIVTYSCNLKWNSVHVESIMNRFLPHCRVFVANDANIAALGESMFGAGKQYSDSVLITLGTGVGSGIVIDGKMFEGYKACGAELGHMVIVVDGQPCGCGRKGCMESYCSATALMRNTWETMQQNKQSSMWDLAKSKQEVSGLTAFTAASKGDQAAKQVVEQFVKYLGEGVVNVINILRPQAVLIGGGISAQGDNLIQPLTAYVKAHTYGGDDMPELVIRTAALGNDAGIVGGGALVISKQCQN